MSLYRSKKKGKQADIASFFGRPLLSESKEPLTEVSMHVANSKSRNLFKTVSGSFDDPCVISDEEKDDARSKRTNFKSGPAPKARSFSSTQVLGAKRPSELPTSILRLNSGKFENPSRKPSDVSVSKFFRKEVKGEPLFISEPLKSEIEYKEEPVKRETVYVKDEPVRGESVYAKKKSYEPVYSSDKDQLWSEVTAPQYSTQSQSMRASSQFDKFMEQAKNTKPNRKIQVAKPPMTPSDNALVSLSKEQQFVIDCVVDKGLNVFYTGAAGTGKSFLTKQLIIRLRQKYGKDAVAVTASTGIAGQHIGGSTLHNFAAIGLGRYKLGSYVGKIRKDKHLTDRYVKTKVLIIDEISMVETLFLEKFDLVAKSVRNRHNIPFGGIQLVVTGDFLQLPPVNKDPNTQTRYCFESELWRQSIKKTIMLTKIYRQQGDPEFASMLNSVRLGQMTPETIQKFRGLSRPVVYEDGIEPTELYAMRHQVKSANERRLRNLDGHEFIFEAKDAAAEKGSQDDIAQLDKNVIAEKAVVLKRGAQVIYLKNSPPISNGTLGIVMAIMSPSTWTKVKLATAQFELEKETFQDAIYAISLAEYDKPKAEKVWNLVPESIKERYIVEYSQAIQSHPKITDLRPVVRFLVNKRFEWVLVEHETFTYEENGVARAERSQLPLILSWALSIHKAQGQTLQRVKVDLGKIFEEGQAYVALSRAVSKEALQILNFNPGKVRASAKVKEYYSTLTVV